MNYEQYLYLKLAEESSEIIQLCSKIMQFGTDSVRPGTETTNKELMHQEITDFLTVVDLLNQELNLEFKVDLKAVQKKKKKMSKYLKYSRDHGHVK